MILVIKNDMQIKDLKKQFHEYYPQLKIEFFKFPHNEEGGNAKVNMLDNEINLADIIGEKEGEIEFNGQSTVAAFEAQFASQFGLNVQVFRKSGNVYIETTRTDDWTLDQEHKEALSFMNKVEGDSSDFTDRDKWE